jgi:hypothetical protein
MKFLTALLKENDPPGMMDFGSSLKGLGKNRRAHLRVFMYMKQGMCCHYCKVKMTFDFPSGKQHGHQSDTMATFEHLIDDWASPEGKDHSLKHIVLACRKCNASRNDERQKRALGYYKAKFGHRADWRKFTSRAGPKDYIKTFGPWEEPDSRLQAPQ